MSSLGTANTVDNPTPNASWYSMLCGVATTAVLQFVLLRLNYQTSGRKIDRYDNADDGVNNYDIKNVAKLLMRIPTLAWNPTSNSTIRSFPIQDLDLDGWKSHFKKIGYEDLSSGVACVHDPDERNLATQHRDLLMNSADELITSEILDHGIKTGVEEALRDEEMVAEALCASGIDKDFFLEDDFMNAASYPSAKVLDPEWTPWLTAMASSNIYGQLELMYHRVAAAQQAMNILSFAYRDRAERLEGTKKLLCEKVVEVRKAMHVVNKSFDKSASLSKDIERLQSEITTAQASPAVKKYLSIMGSRQAYSTLHKISPRSSYAPSIISTNHLDTKPLIL